MSQVIQERRAVSRNGVSEEESDVIHVVVHSVGDRSIGLVVDRIIDIVEESISVEQPASRDGVLGTVVIQGRVTELMDVEAVIRMGDPTFAAEAA